MTMITGARYLIALKTAEYLQHKNPHSEITVSDR